MKKTALLFLAALLCGIAHGQESQRQRLEQHLYTLAADSLRGREAGTDDSRRAANYIYRQWNAMGLTPMQKTDSYSMPFSAGNGSYCNLVAVIWGNDPVLRDEFIVVGAHYDHIGVKGGQIHNGADDNASGSSCLIEVARQLLAKKDQLRRSVIICAFDAEELGLFGSKALVKELKSSKMLDRVKLMLSVDMVGWYTANGELVLDGAGTLDHAQQWLDPKLFGNDIDVEFKSFENSLLTATDTDPFAREGIPTLAVTTGLKSPYHKPEDDADLIDYEGLDHITDYLASLVIAASRHDGALASGRLAPKHHMRRFEVGVAAGYNSFNLSFPDATFDGKKHWGFQGGLMMQYNFNRYFSLRANALYDYSHSMLPATTDAYGKGYGLELHSLLAPVTLQVGVNESGVGVYFGLGGYYGRVLDGHFYGNIPAGNPACDVNANMGGFVINFGFRLGGHWQLDGTWYYQMGDLFNTANGLPKARMNSYSCKLGYYF